MSEPNPVDGDKLAETPPQAAAFEHALTRHRTSRPGYQHGRGRRAREGPLVTRPGGLDSPGSEQDLSDRAADAGRAGLAGDAETDDHLRVRARRQLDPDEVAQLRQLERLTVQGRGHPGGGGAEPAG